MATFGWILLGVSLLLYAGSCVWLVLAQVIYVYTPGKVVSQTPRDVGMEFEELRLTAEDGVVIGAWFIPAKSDNRINQAVLFCHGNAGTRSDRIDSVQTFHDFGMDVLLFDYRGYAESDAPLTEEGTYKDAMSGWMYLKDVKGFAERDIVVFGRSLGGAIATRQAEQVDCKALVVESTFTSAPDMASRMFPFLPTKLLCRFKYDTVARIGNVGCPVLIAHSRGDRVIPYSHAERLLAASSDSKQLLEFEGGHNAGGLNFDDDFQKAFLRLIVDEKDREGSTED